jgi:Cytochrome P460
MFGALAAAAARANRLGALVLSLGCACASHAERGTPVGVSSPRAVGDATTPWATDAGARAVPSPVAADFRSHMARVGERGISRGHADRFDAVLWANEAAHGAWDGSGTMPDGAVLVEEAIERTAKGDRAAGLLVMEKHGEAWRFVLVDAAGHVVEWARDAACASCHKDAPHDFVFRRESASVTVAPPP